MSPAGDLSDGGSRYHGESGGLATFFILFELAKLQSVMAFKVIKGY
jgi:hypothetical protein